MLYKGSIKTGDLYHGSTKIGKLYKGSTLVYESKLPAGQVIFESPTPGTYTITIPKTQKYHIDLVGGGGGGTSMLGRVYTGGSAAYIKGETRLEKGDHVLIIGTGGIGHGSSDGTNGSDSSFNGNIAGRGYGASTGRSGGGGTATVVSSGLTGENGIAGSTVGWINGYGAGGRGGNGDGRSGYCKIVTA